MISVQGLTKKYGTVRAVDDLTFDVKPGRVTGFLGPNGAGKTTTMRMIMGLDRPTAGVALVGGRRYIDISEPLREVGALLDASAMNPGRTGLSHLRIGARSNGLALKRVDELVNHVGLGAAAHRRIKGYSLGMRQRLGIASALLGDPTILLFDEPINGLDLDGVRWIRTLLRGLADEGRTVFVSSHLMSELQAIADHVIIIGRGRLIANSTLDELLGSFGEQRVRVRTTAPDDLVSALAQREARAERTGAEEVEIEGISAAEVGALANALGIPVRHLSDVEQSLEEAYLRLAKGSVEYQGDSAKPALDTTDGAGR